METRLESTYVWEHEVKNRSGQWTYFSDREQKQLEEAKQKGQPDLTLGDRKVDLVHYLLHSLNQDKTLIIRRRVSDKVRNESLHHQYFWQDGDQWEPYPEEVCIELERACPGRVILSVGDFFGTRPREYYVDTAILPMLQHKPTTNAVHGVKCMPFTLRPREDLAELYPAVPTTDGEDDNDPLHKLGIQYEKVTEGEGECSICLRPLVGSKAAEGTDLVAVQLEHCQAHGFHMECLTRCVNNNCIICPLCRKVYGGVQTGDQPDGIMNVTIMNGPLPGFVGCDTIMIEYILPSGTQGPNHPQPGRGFTGVRWRAFLPENRQGILVCKMLQLAWKRRLIFRVDISNTYGEEGGYRVVWNTLHHKTEIGFNGHQSAYSYPDAGYLGRVTDELKDLGIFPDSLN